MKKSLLVISFFLLAVISASAGEPSGWVQSYKSGYVDKNGNYCGGSEIMHIVPHKGKLYAFNGFWKDRHLHPNKNSAQVLRLDSPDSKWVLDFETNKKFLEYTKGKIMHMKGNILKSVTFKKDKEGKDIDVNLLLGAAWAWEINKNRHHGLSVFTRNDETGKWKHTLLLKGPLHIKRNGKKFRVRRVPRDMAVYRDPKLGIDRIFMIAGNLGIISGVYNSQTKQIEWNETPEHPKDGKLLGGRPLGIAEANGNLYFSHGGTILVRTNGEQPKWTIACTISEKGVNPELGGIRGLTTVKSPDGSMDSLLLVWTARGRSPGNIIRLDGKELKRTKEFSCRELYNRFSPHRDVTRHGCALGAYNRFMPVKDPRTGKIVHLVGFQQSIDADKEYAYVKKGHHYKGAMYGIRIAHDKYSGGCVNGKWEKGKPVLVAPRTYAISPFPEEKGAVYFGGYDANFKEATEMAWIFKADIETVLGYK